MDSESTRDLEAQKRSSRSPSPVPSRTSSLQSERCPKVEKALSAQTAESTRPELKPTVSANSAQSTESLRPAVKSIASLGSDLGEQDEESQIFLFANELQNEPAVFAEPWYMEMMTLRRINFIDINNKLAKCRKKLYDTRVSNEDDIKEIRELLHAQGTDLAIQ
jgi:hypothetical protein